MLLAAAGCHSSSPTTCTDCQPPPVAAASITCPGSVSATTASYLVTTAQVSFPSPVATGGTPPVTLFCSPSSNSSFPAGDTTVTCRAIDGIGRSAECTLIVTVNVPAPPIPHLQGTQFLAFGDSITQGNNGCNDEIQPCMPLLDPNFDYPTVLQGLLRARYSEQAVGIAVVNDGAGGESALDGNSRINSELDLAHPNALLILEGVNDFLSDDGSPAEVAAALRYDIGAAKARGVAVFLSTLTPNIYPCSGLNVGLACRTWGVGNVEPANAAIRQLAVEENVVLVDSYPVVYANKDRDIDYDGLHLTRAGRADVAQAFFDAIKKNYETGASPAGTRPRPVAKPSARLR